MSIVKRFVRLMKADIHGILDSIEEPESVLRQAVRDMEESIERIHADLATERTHSERVKRSQQQNELSKKEAERQVDLCFHASNEALAKTFVRRKLECGQRDKLLRRQHDEIERRIAELEQKERSQQEKLGAVREKMEIFCEAAHSKSVHGTDGPDTLFVSEEQVEIALMEERAKRGQSAANA